MFKRLMVALFQYCITVVACALRVFACFFISGCSESIHAQSVAKFYDARLGLYHGFDSNFGYDIHHVVYILCYCYAYPPSVNFTFKVLTFQT